MASRKAHIHTNNTIPYFKKYNNNNIDTCARTMDEKKLKSLKNNDVHLIIL